MTVPPPLPSLPRAPLPTTDALRAELAVDEKALTRLGLRRDPGSYNLLVHMVPPEVARDHAATSEVQARLAQPPGPLGLYLHVAPCTGRCTFCHYAIEVNPSDDALERYLKALRREMTLRWADLDDRSPVRSVLVGGGTPTYLTPRQLDQLLGHLRSVVHLPQGIEITVESSPETLTADKLEVLRVHGVNRLNIGVQSFDDGLLRVLGRRHDGRKALESIDLARQAGLEHVNVDLIYALPGQTLEGWLADVARTADLGVDSLTTYHLRKRPDTVISRQPSPSEDQNLLMHVGALQVLEARGYRHSLVDYFCRADLETGQVQARDKWRDMQPVDGCGLEACSRRPDVIAFDLADMAKWTQAVEQGDGPGGWPLAHGRFLSIEEQMAQRALFALKVLDPDGGIDRAGFAKEFATSVDDVFGEVVAELVEHGMLSDDGATVRLTRTGTLFGDEVCARFYTADLRRRMAARVRVPAEGAVVPHPRGAARKAKATADVVIVGAGIGGLGAAVALADELGQGVLVLDGEALAGQGSTAASIGGFRTQFEDAVLAELTARSMPTYERMATGREGEAIGLKRTGYLFLCTTDAEDAACQAQADVAKIHGEPVQRVDLETAARLVPGMRTDDLVSAWWGPRDGQVDPHGIVQHWQRRLTTLGARLELDQRVRGLRLDRGRVIGVELDDGWIAADTVVLASGSDTAGLLHSAGVTLPLQVARRRMVLAEGPGLPKGPGPLVLSQTPPLYFRAELTGLLLSARELANEGEDWLAVAVDRAMARMPALHQAKFRPAWSGLQVHTPDGRPWVGPCPGLDGLLLLAGLGGTGVMHAPALGQLTAEWWRRVPSELAKALDPRRHALG